MDEISFMGRVYRRAGLAACDVAEIRAGHKLTTEEKRAITTDIVALLRAARQVMGEEIEHAKHQG